MARALPLGGLYVNIRTAQLGNALLACSQTACIKIAGTEKTTPPKIIKNKNWKHKTLLELTSDGQKAVGLFRHEFDDRLVEIPKPQDAFYFLCPIDSNSNCDPVPADTIPYRLSLKKGKPEYLEAKTPEDFAAVIQYDFENLPRSGTTELGSNNIEGNVAWSSVYALNGFVDIIQGLVELPSKNNNLVVLAKQRIELEALLLTQLLGTNYPWVYAKRYSLDREPAASVVHIGRIARLLVRIEKSIERENIGDVICSLVTELSKPSRVIERFHDAPGKRPELRIQRYTPAWADGSNVAWNFQSAWIDGLLYGRNCKTSKRALNLARLLLKQFVLEENLASLPVDWNYARGDLFNGWDQNSHKSSNTLNWKGDKKNTNAAHVAYRSMDAMALLTAHRLGFSKAPQGFVKHARKLVESGHLYPFVGEELVPLGERPYIPFSIARFYARSVMTWDVQNQVWAFDALIRHLPE